MGELIEKHGNLSAQDAEWLHLLVGDWQVISDLAFADLVLWMPDREGDFLALAHARPSTGATVHHDEVVGGPVPEGLRDTLHRAWAREGISRASEARWNGTYAIHEEIIPVVRAGRTLALIARETYLGASRTPSRLEVNYVESADELCGMISRGEFPLANAATGPRRGAPRVGDGLVRLNSDGDVLYASPNALSAFHRLGLKDEVVGRSLAEVVTPLIEANSPVDESLPLVVMGRAAWRTEVEAHNVSMSLRAVPVTEYGERVGAVLLVRDVSELRRRERELLTKDATIREIHHRVKNNLQTVAALLRLQARRTDSTDARSALEEAMRRVATIATVHEALSQTTDEVVDFDEVFGRTLRMAADVASGEAPVKTVRTGAFGRVPATDATALAVVLTELVTNAVEHGLSGVGGTVTIEAERAGNLLRVRVMDDGRGMDGQAVMNGLGTQIVRTLVATELDGSIDWGPLADGGTEVVLKARLADLNDI
ncbi:MAG TPA: histidine kinase N-terminal domain-containing protein [Ruania sp.]|nr:histidine kinase N-terminal domain-containing protein [Ruania sp.]